MVAGGGFDSYLLVKAMTADSLLKVGEAYNVVDGLPFLRAKLETLNLIIKRDSWTEEYQHSLLLQIQIRHKISLTQTSRFS